MKNLVIAVIIIAGLLLGLYAIAGNNAEEKDSPVETVVTIAGNNATETSLTVITEVSWELPPNVVYKGEKYGITGRLEDPNPPKDEMELVGEISELLGSEFFVAGAIPEKEFSTNGYDVGSEVYIHPDYPGGIFVYFFWNGPNGNGELEEHYNYLVSPKIRESMDRVLFPSNY